MQRALLVGINKYICTDVPLDGCVNDVQDSKDFLINHCGFADDDIRLLVDERATKAAIIERLNWLIAGCRAGDRILFHYSGHGALLASCNAAGIVTDLDEAICPHDFDNKNSDLTNNTGIRSIEFRTIFSAVPEGVLFTWLSDSCHSGGLSKELFLPKNKVRLMPMPVDFEWRVQTALNKNISTRSLIETAAQNNVLFIAGCKSDQLSYEVNLSGTKANGALTFFFLYVLGYEQNITGPIGQIVDVVRQFVVQQHQDQEPQLDGLAALYTHAFLA